MSEAGKLKVHRLVMGIDCGHVVNPDQVAAQVEGSVAFGLTAALYGECPVENGRMTALNFVSDTPGLSNVVCLQKPFRPNELMAAIEAAHSTSPVM